MYFLGYKEDKDVFWFGQFEELGKGRGEGEVSVENDKYRIIILMIQSHLHFVKQNSPINRPISIKK